MVQDVLQKQLVVQQLQKFHVLVQVHVNGQMFVLLILVVNTIIQ
jgi:hypothetical protein